MSDQKVTPSGLDEEVDPPVNTCTEVNEEHEEQVNEEHEVVTGEEVDVEVQPDGMKSPALPALLEPQSALVVAGDDADKSKMKHHSSLHSAKDAVYPLLMPLHDAIASLEFDENVLRVALSHFLTTLVTCVCVVTLLDSGIPTNQIYTQVSALTNVVAPTSDGISKGDSTVQFRDIDSVDDIYKWLTDTFIPSVFVSTDHNGNPLPEDQRGRVALTNKVLGGVILEMIPFEFGECDPGRVFTDVYPHCTYTNNAARSINFLDIDMDVEDAKTAIADLKASGSWVNYQTKQLVTTFASYNGIGRTFTATRLTIDFRETGFIEMNVSVKPVPDTRWNSLLILLVVVACVYIGFAVCPELSLAFAFGGKNREQNMKQVFGMLQFFLLKYGAIITFFGLYMKFMSIDLTYDLLALAESKSRNAQEEFQAAVAGIIDALYAAVFWNNLVSIVGAATIVQQGLSLLHQLRFHPQLNLFALTGIRALRKFRGFVIIFGIIFLTYSFAGNILFGGRMLEFATNVNSFESCIGMVFGEFDYGNFNGNRGSSLFYWSYLIIVSVILLNMMLVMCTMM